MAIRPVVVCDVCGQDGTAAHYQISMPDGRVWEVDLCDEHSGPLTHFEAEGIGRPAKRSGGRRRTFEKRTLEEVQAEVSRSRKRP